MQTTEQLNCEGIIGLLDVDKTLIIVDEDHNDILNEQLITLIKV